MKITEENNARYTSVSAKKKIRRNYSALNLVSIIARVMIILFLAWVILSFVNVAMNNSLPETISNIWSWNFFKVFF